MSSSYDKKISLSREQEGSYHRREVEYPASSSSRACTEEPKTYTTTSYKVVVPPKSSTKKKSASKKSGSSSDEDDNNYEEWTTTKRKVNHKTRQVETRVSRQLLLEDGKLIADSGPQVVTRIKEDNKVEECEKEKAPKNKSKFEALESAPEGESSGRVLGEKREIQRTSREVREENMQYHDERYQELTGRDMHQRAIKSPHELITINDQDQDFSSKPRGKMVHYSNRGKKYEDTDEILEVAKLAIDGSITKEITRKKHHEEFSEDELPDEKGEAEALRQKPIHEKSSRTNVDYVNDFDDTSEPESERESRRRHREHRRDDRDEQAFPKYEIDPLLNQLHDKDRPSETSAGSRYREHRLRRRSSSEEPNEEHVMRPFRRGELEHSRESDWRPVASQHHHQDERFEPVPVPEEYRLNRERLLRGKSGKNRSQSPATSRLSSATGGSHRATPTGRSHHHQRVGHREDASVQARLTDEEEEASISSDRNSHRRATKQLERQSTINSRRQYHYGGAEGQRRRHKSPADSVKSYTSSTSSASSVARAKDRLRDQGARSRDSGFKSPVSEQQQQQIYSVSRKSKKGNRDQLERERDNAVSPAPTTGSLGQRSVKTTTTTLSAGLQDRDEQPSRPERRHGSSRQTGSASKSTRARNEKPNRMLQQQGDITSSSTASEIDLTNGRQHPSYRRNEHQNSTGVRMRNHETSMGGQVRGHQADTVSLISITSSSGPRTTIRVPYRDERDSDHSRESRLRHQQTRRLEPHEHSPLVANVEPSRGQQRRYETYNVRVIQHSPFIINSSLAKPEFGLDSNQKQPKMDDALVNDDSNGLNNNYATNFSLDRFFKHKAMPALTNDSSDSLGLLDDEITSSGSMRSYRTYDVRSAREDFRNHPKMRVNQVQVNQRVGDEDDLDDASHFPVQAASEEDKKIEEDEKVAAWVYDIKDGTLTVIKPPPKPKEPEPAKVDARDIALSPGGRAFYLEVLETPNSRSKERPRSIDSLYSRVSTQGSLAKQSAAGTSRSTRRLASPDGPLNQQARLGGDTRSRSNLANKTSALPYKTNLMEKDARTAKFKAAKSTANLTDNNDERNSRRLTPFNAFPLGNRSKSSSCLTGSTFSLRPSKYSIYGGLKKDDDENRPVPRLSYSRAIGPKSKRQLEVASSGPSRYLKMK